MFSRSLLLFTAFIFSNITFAKDAPNSSKEFLAACAKDSACELKLLFEIAKTYRPSKEEDELRKYILEIKKTSENAFWLKELESVQDPVGNLLIRIPGTGKHANKKDVTPFALQSHMDMVLAYANAKPGEDLRPYFKNGIELEVKDGWLQSKNSLTSIGVDNGIGVATAIRYLIDPTIEHVPLELIFTVQEEIGLVGAFQSELPIRSRKMLCLDGMTPEPGYIIAGAQGSKSNLVEIAAEKTETPGSEAALVRVTVTKLAGGHSGGDIHRKRLNAIKAFSQLTKFISSKVGFVGVRTVSVGDIGIYNKIPNLFQAELLISKNNLTSDLAYQIETYMKSMIAQNEDDAKNALVEVTIQNGDQAKYLSTSLDFTKNFVESLLSAPNGVIDQNDKFLNGVYNSNNLSFLEIKPDDQTGNLRVNFGHMTRGFDQNRINEIASAVISSIQGNASSQSFSFKQTGGYGPWLEPETSKLLEETLTVSGYFTKKFYLSGGLEPSAFKAKIQDLEVVALGPFIQMAHSVNERLKIETIEPTVQGVRKIVEHQK